MSSLESDPVPMDADDHSRHDDDDDDDDDDDGCYYYGTLVSPGSAAGDNHCDFHGVFQHHHHHGQSHLPLTSLISQDSHFLLSYRAIMVLAMYPLMSG